MEIENVSQRLGSSERTLVYLEKVVKEETSGRNNLWRIHEIARTIGSRRDAEKLRIGSNGDLLVVDPVESAISEFGV
jgi:hypothetical protein